MATRSLNRVTLIGNLTRDPELRYTPSGMAVCSFGLATNRSWTTQQGEKKEDVQFHKIVAWNRLAELCAQLLKKGRRVFVGGRLQYREWVGSDEVKRQTTEVVIDDMIILDSKGAPDQAVAASGGEVIVEETATEEVGEDYAFMDDVSEELGKIEPVEKESLEPVDPVEPVESEVEKSEEGETEEKEEVKIPEDKPEEEMPF